MGGAGLSEGGAGDAQGCNAKVKDKGARLGQTLRRAGVVVWLVSRDVVLLGWCR